MVTRDRLIELFDFNQVTGVLTRKSAHGTTGTKVHGYIRINVDSKNYAAHKLIWLYVYGEWPTSIIDHINGIKDDNRIINLRIASYSKNSANSKIERKNSSGRKGVSLDKECGLYRARIMVNYKPMHLGRFKTIKEAAAAYDIAAKIYHGEFARGQPCP